MREGSPRRHRPYLCADEIGFERYCRGLSSFSQFLEVKPDCAESAPTRRAFLASGGRRPRYASGEPAQLGPSILFLVVQWRGGRKGREREQVRRSLSEATLTRPRAMAVRPTGIWSFAQTRLCRQPVRPAGKVSSRHSNQSEWQKGLMHSGGAEKHGFRSATANALMKCGPPRRASEREL